MVWGKQGIAAFGGLVAGAAAYFLGLPGAVALVVPALCWLVLMAAHLRALQRELTYAQAALDLGQLPFLVLAEDGRVLSCNPAFEQISGLSRERLLSARGQELLPREWLLAQTRQLARALAGESPQQEQVWLDRPAAGPVLLAMRARLLTSASGRREVLLSCEDCSHLAGLNHEQLEAAGRARAFVQSLIDVIPHPVFVRDGSGRYVLLNEACARALGQAREQILGRTPLEIGTEALQADDILREDAEVFAGRVIFKEVDSCHAWAGEQRHLVVAKGACADASGQPVVVGTYVDVTRWRKAELALQSALERETLRRERTQQYVQRLINVIPQPVYVKDAQSRYLLVNDAFCTERRRTREELMGQSSYGLANDQRLSSAIADEDLRVLAGEVVLKEECLPHMYTGEERFRLITKGSCLDAEGQPVIVGANFDITHWRQAERAAGQAAERERRLRERTQAFIQRLIDVIPEPVYVKDAQSRYLMVNDAFARDFQLPKEEIPGIDSISRVGEEDPAIGVAVRQEDLEVLAGASIRKEDHRPWLLSGEDRHRIVTKGCCEDADGNPVIVVASFDVTRWYQAERALQASLEREKALLERTQQYIQRLIDVIPHPVFVKDEDSRFLLANQSMADYYGCSVAELIGQRSFASEPDGSAIARKVSTEDQAVIREGFIVSKEEQTFHKRTGELRDRLFAKGPCVDPSGRTVLVGTHIDITSLRNAERELRAALQRETERRERTQAFIQRLIDLIPQPVYVKDAESRFMMVNEAQVREMGVPREEIIGLRSYAWIENSHAALTQIVTSEDQEVLAGKVVYKEEHGTSPLNGEERHRLVSKGSCLDADGNPVIVVANFNVTRWYEAERELTEALEREQLNHERTQQYIQRLIDVIPYPVYVKDVDSHFLLVNNAFAQDRGMSKEALKGLSSVTLDVSTEIIVNQTREEDAFVLNSGELVVKEEYKPNPRTGEERYRVISKACCEDATGKPVIVVSVFDVTPWRLAERQLSEALGRETDRRQRIQDYVQRLIDVIPQPVYVKDASSRYILVNEAFAKDRGLSRDELMGRISSVNPEMSRLVFSEDAEVLQGRKVLKEEYRPHPTTGQPRYRVIAKGSCLDDEGRPVIVGANFDVTPWRLAEARLFMAKETAERANAAKSLFLTNMSHELRTPMHGILSFARLGLERAPSVSAERLQGYFDRIVISGERLMGLLNDLLDLAKLESGRMEMHLREQDIHALVREVMGEFEAMAAARGQSLRFDGLQTAQAWVDSKLFSQVLRNLLSNAIKFSAEGSEIEIQLKPGQIEASEGKVRDTLELQVADRGPGIPEEELEAVFDKFVQSSKTRSGAGGTGLGLAICREIVSAHQGFILARNRIGGGAEFVVSLPLEKPEVSALPFV